jgi:arsenite methyltransferase
MEASEIKEMVRRRYGAIAAESGSCCAPAAPSDGCCGAAEPEGSRRLGYSDEELAALPEGADLGLGCGNPQTFASLVPGETVVDLGSGAGIDCFIAARAVGPQGRVIGVDMTPEMLGKARVNAERVDARNVEFRLGEIEHLPIADNTADCVISNCVVNLVPDKVQVYREAWRVLKPGGRLAISDVVNIAPLPPELAEDPALLCGCVAGAASAREIERTLADAGFTDIRIAVKGASREFVAGWAPGRGIEDYVAAATIEAKKPATR